MGPGLATVTYRNARVALVGAVFVIVVSVVVEAAEGERLRSISAYYYTGAQTPLVGALCAASLVLMVIAGAGVERLLLNIAAIFGPIIALAPTTVGAGSVPGLSDHCGAHPCVPPQFEPAIQTGLYTYAIVAALATLFLVVLIVHSARKHLAFGALIVVGATLVVVTALLLATWTFTTSAFLNDAHLTAAGIFFGLIGVVAIYNAFARPQRAGRFGQPYRARRAPMAIRIIYWSVAGLMAVDLIVFGFAVGEKLPVFWLEFAALALFVVFWVTQTIETMATPNKSASIVA